MLTWRGSAPPLPEQTPLDIRPAPVQRLGPAEPLDLDDGVGMINHELVAGAVVGRPDLAPDHPICATEETDHAFCIGAAKAGNRGQNRGDGAPVL
jgi:hypothetical protein